MSSCGSLERLSSRPCAVVAAPPLAVGEMVMRIVIEPAISTGKSHSPNSYLSEVPVTPIARGRSSRLRSGVVWLSDITTVSKAFEALLMPVIHSNYLNTKKGRSVRLRCKNYHVVTAPVLVVLAARCIAQKGYNPGLSYRALIHFQIKKITGCFDCFPGLCKSVEQERRRCQSHACL